MYKNLYSFTSWLPDCSRPKWLALAATLLLAPAAAWAQAPANDDCAGALVLPVGATCTPIIGTNLNATDSAIPAPSCSAAGVPASKDVWYRLVVPTAGSFNVSTSAVAGSSFDDTVVEVYAGSCGSLTSIGCNDDIVNGVERFSSVTVRGQTPGTTVYVRVFGYDASVGTGQFNICANTVPANDDCIGATPLAIGTTCTNTLTTNANATASAAPAPTCGSAATTDVWYSLVVPASGAVVVTTSEVAGSTLKDPVMQLYSGSCTSLTSLGCNDDAAVGNLFPSLTATGLTPGGTVYARVFSFGDKPTGQFNICATTLPTSDAAVQALYTVGKAPVSAPQVVQAVVRNIGANARPASIATLTITGATTFTDTKPVPALAAGASATITFTAYTPSTVGTNTLTVTLPADDLASNNTRSYSQTVTANSLSYVDATQPLNATGVGVPGTRPNGILASKYSISSAATVGEVKLTFPASATTTSTYQVVVLSATTAGLPNTVLFTSPTLSRPTAAGVVTVPVTGNVPVNGTFFVGVKEISGEVDVAYQLESPLRPATFYYQTEGTTTWIDLNTSPVQGRLALEVGFTTRVLSNRNAALEQALSVFPNPAHDQLTLRLPALAGQRTAQLLLTNALGQQVQSRTVQLNAAGTDTQMNVSGLAKGIYTLRVQTADQVATKQVSVE